MGRHTLIEVLAAIYHQPKALQSNFCRDNSYAVARLASLGLISTVVKETYGVSYGYRWRPTFKGLRVLELGEKE